MRSDRVQTKKSLVKFLLALSGSAFLLNFVWELAQRPVFFAGFVSWREHLPECFQATVGDVITILVFYGIIATVRKDRFWIREIEKAELLLLILFGFLWATAIELWAVSRDRWAYSDMMPVLPILNVGLVPVIQMITLPLISLLLGRKLSE